MIDVADGHEAIACLANEYPDIILSDVMMPGIRGDELCRMVKENPDTSGIPVVLLTAKANHEAIVEGLKKGAVVIDVGTTRVPDATKKSGFKLTGDVKFDEVAPKCSFITPVPGGVGPMTIVSLMKNTLLAGKKAIYQ